MARIIFREDILQDAELTRLGSVKLEVAEYNSGMNNVANQLTTLRSDMEAADTAVGNAASDALQAVVDGVIATNTANIATLNGDGSTDGSVVKQINDAITALINGSDSTLDTLKEIVDYINSNGSDFQDLITQLNTRIDDVVGGASDDYNTLKKIEDIVKADKADLQAQIDSIESNATDIENKIPNYKFDDDLAITFDSANSVNNVTLTYVKQSDILNGKVTVYSTDANNGDRIIEGIYTIVPKDGGTNKEFSIQCEDDLSAYKGSVEYFWTVFDQA